jgi:hypothetical protein
MIRAAWLLVLAALALGPARLVAEDTYTIKVKKSAKGDVGLLSKDETEENHTVIMKDGKVLQQMNEVKKDSAKYKEEILEGDGDKPPTKLRRAYDKAQSTGTDGKSKDLPYQGKTLLIEKKGGKTSFKIDGGDELDPKDVPNLVKEFKKDDEAYKLQELFLPKNAVAVGETWKLNKDVVKKLLGNEDGIKSDVEKASATGKLVKAYKKDGKQFGVLQFDFEIPIQSAGGLQFAQGAKATLNIVADVCIDGTADVGTMTGKFALKGDATAPGGIAAQFDVTSNTQETRSEVKK